MYESYWGFESRPFDSQFTAESYYPSETHQAALLQMRYGIESQRRGILLTGESGLGKSMLAHAAQGLLGEQLNRIMIVKHPQLPADQIAHGIARQCDSESMFSDSATLESSLQRIETCLCAEPELKRSLLVVEDAHQIESEATWRLLRSVINLNDFGGKLSLLLVGQTEILTELAKRRDFEQRIDVKCLLRPFSLEDTMGFVSHRLQMVGADREIFDDFAIEQLHLHGGGIPRRINRLADLALVVGFADELKQIDASRIEAVSRQLLLPNAA